MSIQEKLNLYEELLRKWQKKINLVSPTTLEDIHKRHFEDSAQLTPYLPAGLPDEKHVLFDLGSGAGFPGLVLAIMRPDIDTHLFESDARKCAFLRTVSRETNTPVTIHNIRIETYSNTPIPTVITARALAPLTALLEYSLSFAKKNPDLEMLFLKGKQGDKEISDAEAQFSFSYEIHASHTDPEGQILQINTLKERNN